MANLKHLMPEFGGILVSDFDGWSAATTIRMAKRYGHIGHTALISAVESMGRILPTEESENPGGSFDNPFALQRQRGREIR